MTVDSKENIAHDPRETVGESIEDTLLYLPEPLNQNYVAVSCLKYADQTATYLLRQKSTGRLVLLKTASDPLLAASLTNENDILGFLHQQPSRLAATFPTPLELTEDQGIRYYVRTYIKGKTLEELCESNYKKPGLPPEQALDYIISLTELLHFLHTLQPPLIHRDIKPQNVVVDGEGVCHFIDLGISRFFQAKKRSDTVIMGTRLTAPPEQFGYQQTDTRSDLYSLGILLLYCITGEYEVAKISLPELEPPIRQIIQKATMFDPGKRYQTTSELLPDLLAARYSGIAEKPPAPWRRRLLPRLAIALSLALNLCLAGVAVCQRNRLTALLSDTEGTSIGKQTENVPSSDIGEDRVANISGGDRVDAGSDTGKDRMAGSTDGDRMDAGSDAGEDLTTGDTGGDKMDTVSDNGVDRMANISGGDRVDAVSDTGVDQKADISGGDRVDAVSDNGVDLTADSTGAGTGMESETSDAVYTFREPLIEEAVREILNRPSGDITLADLGKVTRLHIMGLQLFSDDSEIWLKGEYPYFYDDETRESGLYLQKGPISSLEDITHMPNLVELSLYGQQISDISVLKDTEIKRLGLGYNPLTDLSPLAGNEALEYLCVPSLDIADTGVLSTLPNLRTLNISDTGITSLAGLENCPLSSLNLFSVELRDFSEIRGLPQLSELVLFSLSRDMLQSMEGLSLKRLEFGYSHGLSLRDFSALPELEDLFYTGDDSTVFSADGAELPHLETLNVVAATIEDFRDFDQLPSLTLLYLYGANVESYQGLDEIPSLQRLICTPEQKAAIQAQFPEEGFLF